MMPERRPVQVFGMRDIAWERRRRVLFCERCGGRCELRPVRYTDLEFDTCTACGNVHFVDPVPFVAVVVVQDGRVLLCRRASHLGFSGFWNLPQGHIGLNEDFLTAGWRETEEESGVRVEIKGILSVVSGFWEHGGQTFGVVLLAEPIGGEAQATDESDAAAWFDPTDLPDLAFEADRAIIARYFDSPFKGAPVDPAYARPDAAGVQGGFTPPPPTLHPL